MYNADSETIKVNNYLESHRKEFNEEIGLALKKYRIENNISSRKLAERAMMTVSYINQIENGSNGISLAKFIIICNALEVRPEQIIENFIYGSKKNEDLFFNELQKEKNLSKNVLEFVKKKMSGYEV